MSKYIRFRTSQHKHIRMISHKFNIIDMKTLTITDILSQSYDATVTYFDNISFLAHALNQLFSPK